MICINFVSHPMHRILDKSLSLRGWHDLMILVNNFIKVHFSFSFGKVETSALL